VDMGGDFAWLSLLQRRADYARRAASTAHTPGIAKAFEELAELYDGIAGRAEAQPERSAMRPGISRSDAMSDLVKLLQSRSHQFLREARGMTDQKHAEELKFLAGAFGAEAARLKNDSMR
jgi:hypothetical protein